MYSQDTIGTFINTIQKYAGKFIWEIKKVMFAMIRFTCQRLDLCVFVGGGMDVCLWWKPSSLSYPICMGVGGCGGASRIFSIPDFVFKKWRESWPDSRFFSYQISLFFVSLKNTLYCFSYWNYNLKYKKVNLVKNGSMMVLKKDLENKQSVFWLKLMVLITDEWVDY